MSRPPKELRQEIVEFLHRQLVGPSAEKEPEKEILREPASKRYIAGILEPQLKNAEHVAVTVEDSDDECDADGTATMSVASTETEDSATERGVSVFGHSSFGISLLVRGRPCLSAQVSGARYETTNDGFRRVRMDDPPVQLKKPESGRLETLVLQGHARLTALWRPHGSEDEAWLVTVSLANEKEYVRGTNQEGQKFEDLCLHQPGLRIWAENGASIGVYPSLDQISDKIEDRIIQLLYRDAQPFAVGHNCAVEWESPTGNQTNSVWMTPVPMVEVPAIGYDVTNQDSDVLSMQYLALSETYHETLIGKLKEFVTGYECWMKGLPARNCDIPESLAEAKRELQSRQEAALERMRGGIAFLEGDATAALCFRMANQAMALQRLFSKSPGYAVSGTVEERLRSEQVRGYAWRPFQLAFLLLCLCSVASPDDQDRKLVDLIWFPTGGGKTEAYLATTAFLLFWRRCRYGDEGAGTAVIMRYTLRLLTTQQFQRAAALLCACDLLVRTDPEERFGQRRMTIGLWVGQKTTPNTFRQAADALSKMRQGEAINPFQIESCPCCGSALFPTPVEPSTVFGIRMKQDSVVFFCPNHACDFHDSLPIQVVDDALYRDPPSMLLATVDKFAQIPWEPRSRAFLGEYYRPPDLIIQDELHLISGPLGSIVGLYEMGLHLILEKAGVRPKIIASTATIHRADEQCEALYSRKASLFPPSGLHAADSYFAHYDDTRPGRLYVGVMSTGVSQREAQARISAGLLQAPVDLKHTDDELDAYWTLVTYHNTLRDTGTTMSMARSRFRQLVELIARDQDHTRMDEHRFGSYIVEELTSRRATSLSRLLERLDRAQGEGGVVSVLACTNILSVGVDLERLNLMLVVNQPKSTAEYIQATSRVGRARVPGLVVTLYNSHRPRDLSHFEQFRNYHGALYQHVEPTSATPFSPPARDRALHAQLVAFMRACAGLTDDAQAGAFNQTNESFQWFREAAATYIEVADSSEAEAARRQLDLLGEQWESWATGAAKKYHPLHYKQSSPMTQLLVDKPDRAREIGWFTLHSMRSVEPETGVQIVGREKHDSTNQQ